MPVPVFMNLTVTVVRDHHIYKTVWAPLIDEMLQVHGIGSYQQT